MNTRLKASLFLNLGLLGCVVYLMARSGRRLTAEAVSARAPEGAAQATQAAIPVYQTLPDQQPKRFRWSQIESTDYRRYIANLRGIGCPEQTIRDIIVADVDNLYRVRAGQIRGQLAALATDRSQPGSKSALEAESQELPGEEAAVIAELLGLPTVVPAQAGVKPPPDLRAARKKLEGNPVTMPLAFQEVDPAALNNLNGEQKQAIADLRENFIEQLGDASQNPKDPAYRERWEEAQPEIDGALLGAIGPDAYGEFQEAAAKH